MRTYDAVVGAAADESGGQGFVTEYAQPSERSNELVVQDDESATFERVSTQQLRDFLGAHARGGRGFSTWDGFEEAVDAALTRPESLSVAEYLGCPECYEDDANVTLDHARFIEVLTARVYEPMASTQRLLTSRPYATRLYTTMSADEMTVDPLFNFNGDLPDVRTFTRPSKLVACDGSFRVTLPQGGVVYGASAGTWPIDLGGDHPAARVISELGTSGDGQIVVDNSADILALLDRALPPPTADAGPDGGGPAQRQDGLDGGDAGFVEGDDQDESDGCDCAVPGAPAKRGRGIGWLSVAAVMLALSRRRRR